MIHSLRAASAASGASSYGVLDSLGRDSLSSREPFLAFHPLDGARMPSFGCKHFCPPLQMLDRGYHALLAPVPSCFVQSSRMLSNSDCRSSDHDGRHCLTLSNGERPFKSGGILPIAVLFQKRKIAGDFICLSCRADLSRTSGEKQYRRSAETLDESDKVSIWDSNAEGIRRSSRKNRPSSPDFRQDERASRNWDYASDTDSRTDNWQWWRSSDDDDTYKGDTDDEEDVGFSWFNFDIKSALSMFGWMFPAAVVFLPWLLGSPLLMTMAFALFPLVQKVLGPLLPDIWGALLQSWTSSSSKSKQKKRKKSSVSSKDRSTSRSDMGKANYPGFSAWGNYGRSLDSFGDDLREEAGFNQSDNEGWARLFTGNKDKQGQRLKRSGWDESEEDTLVVGKLIQDNRKTNLKKKRRKREVPLFFRLLVALFPFLRSWGGFL